MLRPLQGLPSSIFDRGRVRRYLSKFIAKAYGYTGYFQIYNLPFRNLPMYDYSEKRDIFRPHGINIGTSIFDDLAESGIPHHVSDWRLQEKDNLLSLSRAVKKQDIAFAFLYSADLDALMHDHTRESPLVDDKLRFYQERAEEIMHLASTRYEEVRFAMFSDHGMATVRRVVDLMPRIERLPFEIGKDYAAVYDSTMLRFWFLRSGVEPRIREALPDGQDGHFVTEEENRQFGTYWADGKFGQAVYALEPGVLLNPSHMGRVALKGMHGYRPDHPDSNACLLANFVPETKVSRITDDYYLMREMAAWASGAPLANPRPLFRAA